MITSFHDDETRQVWEDKFSKKLPEAIQAVARRKLRMLNNAQRIEDLRIPPNNRLEPLRGNRKGQWSLPSMTSGGSASSGMRATRGVSKFVTTTEEAA